VWDWPTISNADLNLSDGKEKIYTSYMNIDIEFYGEKKVNKKTL